MKISILGMPILEIEWDRPVLRSQSSVAVPESPKTQRALSALEAPANTLPRTPKGTVDVQASLKMFALANGIPLWQRHYKHGSAGAALKRIIATQGLIPDSLAPDPTKPDLRTFPAKDLPARREPTVLTSRPASPCSVSRIQPSCGPDATAGSAGGRLKMLLRRERPEKTAALEQQVRAPAPATPSRPQSTLNTTSRGRLTSLPPWRPLASTIPRHSGLAPSRRAPRATL